MKSFLVFSHLQVENANAVSGLTYGFPAVSNFLGFTHALSRKLKEKFSLTLGGCAVICHEHHVNMHKTNSWGEHVFCLTRNPLTKEGKTASFIEAARMSMTVSLVVEVDFDVIDLKEKTGFSDPKLLIDWLKEQVFLQRLAGGNIIQLENIRFYECDSDSKNFRKTLLYLLPGFLLIDRNNLLKTHYEKLKEQNSKIELIEVWLDFVRLVAVAEKKNEEDDAAGWSFKKKPASGWLVPIVTGFKGISPLHDAGKVKNARDNRVPFQFVEPAYSIGEWISPHRIRDYKAFNSIFWRHHYEKDWYLCHNDFYDDE